MRYSARAVAAMIVAFAFSNPASAWTVDLEAAGAYESASPFVAALPTPGGPLPGFTARYDDLFDGSPSNPDGIDGGIGGYNTGATRGLSAMTESGGVVTMDASAGEVSVSSLSGNTFLNTRLRPTYTADGDAHGNDTRLYADEYFVVGAQFSIATPDPRSRYGVRLRDGDPAQAGAIPDFVEAVVRTNSAGQTYVSMRQWTGNTATSGIPPTGSNAVIDQFLLSDVLGMAPGATSIVLGLMKPGTNGDIYGGFALRDSIGNILFADVFGGTGNIFHGEGWTRMEMFTTQVVPEPSTWLLMGIGLIGLLVTSRRRLS
jgi:hypothetical protein